MSGSDTEQRTRRVASRIGDDPSLSQFAAMKFAEAVNRLLKQIGRRMVRAVSRAIGRRILQPEVGGNVDGADTVANELRDERRTDPLGQARDDDFGATLNQIRTQLLERRQIDAGQMTINVGNLAAGIMLRSEDADLDERVAGKKADGLDTGVTGRTQHRYLDPILRRHQEFPKCKRELSSV